MVSFAEIQVAYNKMYAQIRKYIWDFPVVEALADLEIAIYKTCQDLDELRARFIILRSFILNEYYSDEDLRSSMDYLESLLDGDEVYVKLNQVNEVVQL